jgi:23S rRNA pseudouridine1911/1915/1917 synthase
VPEILQHTSSTSADRLDKYLVAQGLATSRSEAQRWIEDGFVLLNGASAKASHAIKPGDALEIRKPGLKTLDLTPKKIDFTVLFEDEDVLVLDKPAGLVVHPGAGNYDESLVHGLLHHCEGGLSGIGGVERPGIVHRLDKGTSGVMVVAKSDFAHRDLSNQFQNHEIEKEYRALVVGRVEKTEQTLVHLMKRAEFNRKKFVVNQKKGKKAVTHVTVLNQNPRVSLVSVKIETGRTHQIRVHMSHIGHPVLGDETYGGTKKLHAFDEDEKKYVRDLKRPLLHSHELAFRHPRTGKKMSFRAALPQEFQDALEKFLPK